MTGAAHARNDPPDENVYVEQHPDLQSEFVLHPQPQIGDEALDEK